MAAETKSPLIAVDTNVLLDLAADVDFVWDAINTIRERIPGAVIVATSTVIAELAAACDDSANPKRQCLALKAAQSLIDEWHMRPLDFKPVGHGITQSVAEKIIKANLLPEKEINDSYLIAEASLGQCRMLISSDAHIKNINCTHLAAVLAKADVPTPIIVSPWRITKDFFAKK